MTVFDINHISTKPTNARLLSSIWSYHRKHSPIGEILKYKSPVCESTGFLTGPIR